MTRPGAAIGGVSALALLAAATVPKLVGGGGDAAGHRAPATLAEAGGTGPLPHGSRAMSAAQASVRPAAIHPARPSRQVAHHAAPRTVVSPRPAPRAAHAAVPTTSTPQATIASVGSHVVRHASGGAGLTAAPRRTVAKPRASAVHRAPSVPVRHSSTISHTSGGEGVRATTTQPASTRASNPPAPPVSSGAYVNPLAHARVTPERIDQGVDYSGSGTLGALGAGRVIYVGTSGTGWPGAFIEYRLTSGADAGRYVYYAEGVSPLVRVGQTLQPGQSVATMSGGIEVGWGSGVGTQPLAQAEGQWGNGSGASNVATAAGRSFSALIASLGGPPGKVEG